MNSISGPNCKSHKNIKIIKKKQELNSHDVKYEKPAFSRPSMAFWLIKYEEISRFFNFILILYVKVVKFPILPLFPLFFC